MANNGNGEASSFLANFGAGSRRTLSLAGGVGVAVGLLAGIPIGRATVAPRVNTPTKVVLPATEEIALPPPAPEPVLDAYRASFVHRIPKGSKGIRRETAPDGRRTGKIDAEAASLQVSLQPRPGEAYALSAIVRVEGSGSGKLQAAWDGQAIGTWDVASNWTLVSSPVPAGILAGEKHEALLTPKGLPKDAVVRFDSVAVLPVGDELHFDAATDSAGHLVEGFSIPESRFVWSNGQRSVVGGVLEPTSAPYELTVRGSAYSPLAPISVQLSVNGKSVGGATVTKKPEDVVWHIPGGLLRAGANQLAFEYSNTGQPSKLKPGSKDERSLAMRFISVSLAPRD